MRHRKRQMGLIIGVFGLVLIYSFFSFTPLRRLWNPIYETSWQLSQHPGYETIQKSQVSIHFRANTLYGQSYVNSFSAKLVVGLNSKLQVSNMVSTLMASLDSEVQAAEGHFLAFLNQELRASVNKDTLQLCSESECLVFIRILD